MSAGLDYDNAEATWEDATHAAALLAVDPPGVGGVCVRSLPGPVRDRWVQIVRELLPEGTPWRRIPISISDSRLLGGLELSATLRAGRPVVERGVLAEVDGGIAVLAMAERIALATAGKIGAVLDNGEVRVERDGLADRMPTSFGVIALDEGVEDDERPVGPLRDRIGCHLELSGIPVHVAGGGFVRRDVPLGRALAARAELLLLVPEDGRATLPAVAVRHRGSLQQEFAHLLGPLPVLRLGLVLLAKPLPLGFLVEVAHGRGQTPWLEKPSGAGGENYSRVPA